MSVEKFFVDDNGELWSSEVGRMYLNPFYRTSDANLLRGKYEKSAFGMSEREKRAAISLGLFIEQ